MPRRNKQWYLDNGKPLPETFEKKNYNWYVQRGLKPPSHLKVPKVIKDTVGNLSIITPTVIIEETDAQIEARIKARFEVLEALVDDAIDGDVRALIVSGPPGLGKSFTVETKLKHVENTRIIKGHSSAKALYELLYEYKDPESIVVFDDCDSVFTDEKALNLLKTALDTTEERVLSWLTSGPFGGENQSEVPTSYVFEGSIIFITNLDFDGMIARDNKIAKHLQAIVSRAHYIDLMMKGSRDYVIRIKQVVRESKMLRELNTTEAKDVIKFIEDNVGSLREISLRTALKVATLRKSGKENWEHVAKVTCCKV